MSHLFQQFYQSFVTLVILFLQINKNSCQTYDGNNQGYTSVPNDIPSGMTRITLNKNEISQINNESFNENSTDFSAVQKLYLEYNKITNVGDTAFEGFQDLRNIYLKFNQVKHMLLKVEDIPRLESLNLNFNHMTQMPIFHGFFQSFGKLTVGQNSISHVHEWDFENITNVYLIYLARNRIVTFEPKQELPNLASLTLARNRLTEDTNLKRHI